jgi:hypothetical protein
MIKMLLFFLLLGIMSLKYSVASTIYNLKYNKTLESDNFEFIIDYKVMTVVKIIFINERDDYFFSNITGNELFKFFNI